MAADKVYKAKEKSADFGADTDILLESFRKNKDNKLKILPGLYKGQYLKLLLAVVLFAVKHCPVWVLPIATANIINIATPPDENALRIRSRSSEREACLNSAALTGLRIKRRVLSDAHLAGINSIPQI